MAKRNQRYYVRWGRGGRARAGDVMKSGSKEEGIRGRGKIEKESEGPNKLCRL